MSGVSIGFFSPAHEFNGKVDQVCERISSICGPYSQAFPFAISPVKGPDGMIALSYGVIGGSVPIHIDPPNAAERTPALFTFVVAAENRPVLLVADAAREASECVFLPESGKASKMAFGALELLPGRVVHFDITRNFHGITGFPTGDLQPDLPAAVVIQVPFAQERNIQAAVEIMRKAMRADERFADIFVRTGDDNAIRGGDARSD